jgi:hypothetical protein
MEKLNLRRHHLINQRRSRKRGRNVLTIEWTCIIIATSIHIQYLLLSVTHPLCFQVSHKLPTPQQRWNCKQLNRDIPHAAISLNMSYDSDRNSRSQERYRVSSSTASPLQSSTTAFGAIATNAPLPTRRIKEERYRPTSTISRLSQQSTQRRNQQRQKMKPMPILGYSARSILAYYDLRPLEVGWRLNSLGFPLLGMRLCVSYDCLICP